MTVQTYDLVYPMLTLFCWTFLIMLRNVQVRVRAVLKGELTNEYFELFRGPEPPEEVLKTGNNLRNLSEFPPLFYVAALAIMVTARTDAAFIALAWSYVALRIGHSMVHLTFNKVPVRFFLFILSNAVLLVIWIRLGVLV
jgi:hypothetical protein